MNSGYRIRTCPSSLVTSRLATSSRAYPAAHEVCKCSSRTSEPPPTTTITGDITVEHRSTFTSTDGNHRRVHPGYRSRDRAIEEEEAEEAKEDDEKHLNRISPKPSHQPPPIDRAISSVRCQGTQMSPVPSSEEGEAQRSTSTNQHSRVRISQHTDGDSGRGRENNKGRRDRKGRDNNKDDDNNKRRDNKGRDNSRGRENNNIKSNVMTSITCDSVTTSDNIKDIISERNIAPKHTKSL